MSSVTRSIPPSLASVIEELELEQPTLVTADELTGILIDKQVGSDPYLVAARLRERGWLLATDRRGVWEFVPGAAAGPYSRHDPVTPLRAFLKVEPGAGAALTFQSAAWAHQLAERAPATLEVATTSKALAQRLPRSIEAYVFRPRLPYQTAKDVPVLSVESVIVHMAARPADVRYWMSAMEWLPRTAAKATWDRLTEELHERATSVRARTGYLLSGMRPDLAEQIRRSTTLRGKTWFGRRESLLHHDSEWQIADTLLPFDPRRLDPVT